MHSMCILKVYHKLPSSSPGLLFTNFRPEFTIQTTYLSFDTIPAKL